MGEGGETLEEKRYFLSVSSTSFALDVYMLIGA